MTDPSDRKKSLEEEYFHRQNQEAIEKLRAKIHAAAKAKEAGPTSMQCPRCDGQLKEFKFEDVAIDTCDKCAGVWLDSGELALITKRASGGWFNRLVKSWTPE